MKSERERDRSVERLLQRSLATSDSSTAEACGECPDPETLAAWIDGALGEREVALIEAHASACGRCQALLAAVVQSVPEASLPAWQETWWRSWGLRWLVPLAATAAAAVILWVAVPNDKRPDLPEQASTQLPNASPTPPQPKAGTERFNAPSVAAEQPGAANTATAAPAATAATVAKADDKIASIGPSERERELRKENAASADQAASDRLDTLGAQARAAPSAADAAQPQSSLNETVAVARQAAKAGPLEISSPDPSVRWRVGGGRSVERTTNGGTSWETLSIGVSGNLTAGASPSRSVCWLVGRGGAVLLSTDGRSWRQVPFPEMVDLTAVQAADAQTATVTTANRRTFRTTDGGRTWN